MEKYIGTYHKSSPFIQNLLKKQICSFEILWQNYPPPVWRFFSWICYSADLLKSVCRNPPHTQCGDFFSNLLLCRFTEICMQYPPPLFGDFLSNLPLCRFTEICMQKSPPTVKGIVGNSAIVISTRHWEQHISFALGNFNLFQQTR